MLLNILTEMGCPLKIKVGCMYMKVKLNLYICRTCAEHAT